MTPTVVESADLRRASHEAAKQVHAGQTYGDGRDFYNCHLLPVVAELKRACRDHLPAGFEAAAVLHDCLEQDVKNPLPGSDVQSRAQELRKALDAHGAHGPLKELAVDAVVLLTGTGRRRADRNLDVVLNLFEAEAVWDRRAATVVTIAVCVKLADRIVNLQGPNHSMVRLYLEEHPAFVRALQILRPRTRGNGNGALFLLGPDDCVLATEVRLERLWQRLDEVHAKASAASDLGTGGSR